MLGNSTVVVVVVVVVVRTRPRAIPLAKITMRKSTHGFPLPFSCMMSMGLRLAALRAAGAPLKSLSNLEGVMSPTYVQKCMQVNEIQCSL